MTGLHQLKKRLRSIQVTSQLADAMKTVASAKFSKLNSVLKEYTAYADNCEKMLRMCGGISKDNCSINENAPQCFIVIGANRGLCGGYNAELAAFAEECIKNSGQSYNIVIGKKAIAYFEEKNISMAKSLVLSDIPQADICMELISELYSMYLNGEISSVKVIYTEYINTLTQLPKISRIMPLTGTGEDDCGDADRILEAALLLPDDRTVYSAVKGEYLSTVFYRLAVEAAIGVQAATLLAMRNAYDNAQEASAKLETLINKKRQSEVTADVIETSADLFREDEVQ